MKNCRITRKMEDLCQQFVAIEVDEFRIYRFNGYEEVNASMTIPVSPVNLKLIRILTFRFDFKARDISILSNEHIALWPISPVGSPINRVLKNLGTYHSHQCVRAAFPRLIRVCRLSEFNFQRNLAVALTRTSARNHAAVFGLFCDRRTFFFQKDKRGIPFRVGIVDVGLFRQASVYQAGGPRFADRLEERLA